MAIVKMMTNPTTLFALACEMAHTPTTKRQWSKFKAGKGKAHTMRALAKQRVNKGEGKET
jgi:hypothetical protein